MLATYQQRINSGQIMPDSAQSEAAEKLAALQKALDGYSAPGRIAGMLSFLSKPPARGIYIHGAVGRGKSMLMDLFFDNARVAKKERIHFHSFMREIHAYIHQWRKTQPDDHDPILPLARMLRDRAHLLCLDELEVRDIADAMILARLFTMLMKRGVVLVMTSNQHPKNLYANGLQRDRFLHFVDMMLEKIDVVEINSPTDFRLKKIKSMQSTYITPLGDEATAQIEAAFASLNGIEKPAQSIINVQGRDVVVARATTQAAIFSFDELCRAALGPADYMAIAGRWPSLCIKDIPAMSPEQRNEARRFITLIDAIYEHRTKLVCSAETMPEKLYITGSGSDEFKRTVSRLREMQSEAYLAEAHNNQDNKAA